MRGLRPIWQLFRPPPPERAEPCGYVFCFIIAYIDRINVGFAKLHLREVLGVSEEKFSSAYGLGAGLFFIGYFLFEDESTGR